MWSGLRGRGFHLMESVPFQASSAVMIITNALIIGMETDMPDWGGWDIIENMFLIFFTLELVLRTVVVGPARFFGWQSNTDFVWNLFDLVIVSLGIFDLLATLMAFNISNMSFATSFRIIRLLRILRIFRIIRFLKQLYLLAYGFVEAAIAIFWVTILMAFVLYICAIVLTRLYGRTLADDPNHDFLREHFGSVPSSMLTLFELMSQPDLTQYDAVIADRPSILPFLVSFIIFGSFGMIALLSGVISESMFEKNQAKVEAERSDRELKRVRFQEQCQDLFARIDADGDGLVSGEELCLWKGEIVALLGTAGVPFTDLQMKHMFNALDLDASGLIDMFEFENGILEMCEDIRPMSIMELHNQLRKCQMKVDDCSKQIVRQSEMILEAVRGRYVATDGSHLPVLSLGHGEEFQRLSPDDGDMQSRSSRSATGAGSDVPDIRAVPLPPPPLAAAACTGGGPECLPWQAPSKGGGASAAAACGGSRLQKVRTESFGAASASTGTLRVAGPATDPGVAPAGVLDPPKSSLQSGAVTATAAPVVTNTQSNLPWSSSTRTTASELAGCLAAAGAGGGSDSAVAPIGAHASEASRSGAGGGSPRLRVGVPALAGQPVRPAPAVAAAPELQQSPLAPSSSVDSPPLSQAQSAVLEEFRGRLDEVVSQLSAEVVQAQAAVGHLVELLACQTEQASRLGSCSLALSKVSAFAAEGRRLEGLVLTGLVKAAPDLSGQPVQIEEAATEASARAT